MYEEIVYYSDGLKIASHLYAAKGWKRATRQDPLSSVCTATAG